jgi:site-specific recombinase XerD
MSATINVVCYKSKTLANGEHPLMIRVCKDNKKVYKSLGISISAKEWDFKKEEPKRACVDRDLILKLIDQKKNEYREQILELKTSKKEFSARTVLNKIEKPINNKCVKEFFEEIVTRMKLEKRLGNAGAYKATLSSMTRFAKKLDISFNDIDLPWLKQYETWMRSNDNSENTMGIHFRALRAAYNMAIEDNIIKKENYPFDRFKVGRFNKATRKRAITKADIGKIIDLNVKTITTYYSPHLQLSKDLFLFSYLGCGINFMDIANLKNQNIYNNRVFYERHKTGKQINFLLQPMAVKIIECYKPESPKPDDYIFPILDKSFHITLQQKYDRTKKVLRGVNNTLKKIGEKAGLSIPLTTYVARHTFATVLKRSGVNTAIISESLGHSSEKITQTYLDSFENSQIDEAMKCLL